MTHVLGISCAEYARKMSRGCWGGGIEMACMSRMKGCNVHVYEKNRTGGSITRRPPIEKSLGHTHILSVPSFQVYILS